ncbi:DnaD domain protein [Amygdalobacter nucleatus]|uniref:DnaD domain protein n=1 Tax=Amygdalobacter nucleatus TaxID=3029274 RepID=UPI0027A31B84|nr:DnaD domain protein [Amygdalobacter nucleatus]WEG37525.1 DnaD domain protein [Amygdalobacter nucleatus]
MKGLALQFSEQFMQHYLGTLSPLAWKLYLHLSFICSQRKNWQLQANEIELEPVNQFVNNKQYKAELKAATAELQQQSLLKADYPRQCLWLVSPDIQQKLWDLADMWQQELQTMSEEQKQNLTRSNFVLAQVDACTANNQKLLDYLLATKKQQLNANLLGQTEQTTAELSSTQASSDSDETEYNELVQAINQRFLVGFSSYSWINLIDKLHHEYHFENTLIYAIFATLQSEGHLYKDQIQRLADNLHKENITSAEAFDKWLSEQELIAKRRPFVQANLQRHNLTTADMQIVNKWFDEYAYDEEIIKYLFSKSVESTNPTLTWFDAIITRWHNSGYKTLEEIQQAEKEFKAKPKRQAYVRSGLASYQPRSQKENYTERHYDADFYKKLMQGSKHTLKYD